MTEGHVEQAKTSTGLGKGLAGILGAAQQQSRAPEVSQLLGSKAVRHDPEVRKLVSELGLRYIADSFGSDGALIARREHGEDLPTITSQLPAEWSTLDRFGFTLAGRLWHTMERSENGAEQIEIAGKYVLLSKQSDSESNATAATVVRGRLFTAAEQTTIVRLLHSISAAASGDGFDVALDGVVDATVEPRGTESVVTLTLLGPAGGPTSTAVGASEASAAATAACGLCSQPLTIQFAGETVVNKTLVSLVVARTGSGGSASTPIFGLAVGASSSALGAAEAVFRAARVIEADPFVDAALA